MSTVKARGSLSEVTISAVVTRADGRVEALGAISYWSKAPWRRLLWRISRWLHW